MWVAYSLPKENLVKFVTQGGKHHHLQEGRRHHCPAREEGGSPTTHNKKRPKVLSCSLSSRFFFTAVAVPSLDRSSLPPVACVLLHPPPLGSWCFRTPSCGPALLSPCFLGRGSSTLRGALPLLELPYGFMVAFHLGDFDGNGCGHEVEEGNGAQQKLILLNHAP